MPTFRQQLPAIIISTTTNRMKRRLEGALSGKGLVRAIKPGCDVSVIFHKYSLENP